MATVIADGTTLYYETRGDPGRPTVAFLPDAGFGPWVWGWQAPSLSGAYHTIVYAGRGTDGSDDEGPYSVDRFAADLEVVLADAGVDRVHLVGAGLGGMVALRHARESGRGRSLTLFGAASSGDRVDRDALSALHPTDPTRFRESLGLAYTDRFLAESGVVDDVVAWRRAEDAIGDALDGHLSAVLAFQSGPLYEIALPTLVCHGVDDPIVPVAAGRDLAAELPRARFEAVAGKRCCFAEYSAAVNDVLDRFLDEVTSEDPV